MSRHRNVRGMDLSLELDDYDYNFEDDYDENGEMTAEDKVQLKAGLTQVRAVIGYDMPGVTDKIIEDALWEYYYDVEKTVDYVLNTYRPPTIKSQQKKKPPVQTKAPAPVKTKDSLHAIEARENDPLPLPTESDIFHHTRPPLSPQFWDDAPWGRIPDDRRAVILVGSQYPRGGLLGGSGAAKSSKLAALAKARKAAAEKKQQETVGEKELKGSVFLLSKLTKSPPSPSIASTAALKSPLALPAQAIPINDQTQTPTIDHVSSMVKEELEAAGSAVLETTKLDPQPIPPNNDPIGIPATTEALVAPQDLRASPSLFASSVFGERLMKPSRRDNTNIMLFYYTATIPATQATVRNAFSGPSPDDIVIAAQSQSKGLGAPKAKPKESVAPTKDVSDGLKELNITQPSAVSNTAEIERVAKTSKNLNILEKYKKSNAKENSNFVVIGHVDAGKSTLMGRLLYDLGVVDERTLKRYKTEAEKIGKSSFAFAWVLDQTKEERNRGVTIDIAMNRFETSKTEFTILDAPGHKDFVPNMIAGASQADFAVLVIDSTTGEFETGFNTRGQTKEHTLLVRSMGVQRIIVAVNKLDNMDWSQERFEEIKAQMSQFLSSVGFHPRNVSFVPCSGLTGDNITRKAKEGLMPWYNGSTLVEELEKSKPVARAVEKPFRLTVTDVFRGGVMHPVSISGRIEAGSAQIGDIVLAMPSGERAAIKAIEVDDAARDWAIAGHNVVLHLAGIDMIHLRTGDILCDPKSPAPAATSFTVKILAFESITPMAVDIHRGRLNASGKISKLITTLDKSTGAVIKKKPRHIIAGGVATIQVDVVSGSPGASSSIPVDVGTRIVLRAEGTTVAAGLVESINAAKV